MTKPSWAWYLNTELYRGDHITRLSKQSVSATQGSWRLLSLNYGAAHSLSHSQYTLKLLRRQLDGTIHVHYHRDCPSCIYINTTFRAISKHRPQGHINFICRCNPELAMDWIIRPRSNRTIGFMFRTRPIGLGGVVVKWFGPYFDSCSSSHRRGIFLTSSHFTPMGGVG